MPGYLENQHKRKGTSFKLITLGGKKLFVKSFSFNPLVYPEIAEFKKYLLDYIARLEKAKIPLPKLKSSEVKGNKVIFATEFIEGNLLKKIEKEGIESLTRQNRKYLDKIVEILKAAIKHKVCLDPHIKNFLFNKKTGKVFYIDFSPPYTKEYLSYRMKFSHGEDKQFLKKFFKRFCPDELGYHFISDMLKVDSSHENTIKEIYSILRKNGIISAPFDKSMKIVRFIRQVEEEKVRRNMHFSPT